MVVACVGLLRRVDGGALTLVLQLATGVAGGIIGNAMREVVHETDAKKARRKRVKRLAARISKG